MALGSTRRHLPTSFVSTANVNETLAFCAKDALLVVDQTATRLRRGPSVRQCIGTRPGCFAHKGNAAGRERMRADGTLKPAKPPRGMLLATGEEHPKRPKRFCAAIHCRDASR